MKRRAVMDTLANREVLESLDYTYIPDNKSNKIFIKVSNSDLNIIKELLPDMATGETK